jgi:hypothetical protein
MASLRVNGVSFVRGLPRCRLISQALSILLGILSCAGVSFALADDWSAELIRAELYRSQDKIESFEVTYKMTSLIDNPEGRYILRTVVAKRPCFLYHYGAHGSARTNWKYDPMQQGAWVLADQYFNEFTLDRSYFCRDILPTDALPGTLKTENWFQLTGCWPLRSRKPPLVWHLVPMLYEVALSAEYSNVRDQLEKVDGHRCHVLECSKGGDALWLDLNRGGCLMRRESTDPQHGKLFGRIELTHHREVSPGIWLPYRIRSQAFSWSDGDQRLTNDTLTEVFEIHVNDVPDERFTFTPRPGSILLNPKVVNSSMQTEPGGLDQLDEVVAWTVGVYGRPHHTHTPRIVSSVCALIVVFSTAAFWVRQRKNVVTNQTSKLRKSNKTL